MKPPIYWNAWLKNADNTPPQALNKALEAAKLAVDALNAMNPESLASIEEEIDEQVRRALLDYARDVTIDAEEAGVFELFVAEGSPDIKKRVTLSEALSHARPDFDGPEATIAWAEALESAALALRHSADVWRSRRSP